MGDLSGFTGAGVHTADAVDRVPKAANIHEAVADGEEERSGDQPQDDDGELNFAGLAIVPEGDVPEDDGADGVNDEPTKGSVEFLGQGGRFIHRGSSPGRWREIGGGCEIG